jgi:hypothetical protein
MLQYPSGISWQLMMMVVVVEDSDRGDFWA